MTQGPTHVEAKLTCAGIQTTTIPLRSCHFWAALATFMATSTPTKKRRTLLSHGNKKRDTQFERSALSCHKTSRIFQHQTHREWMEYAHSPVEVPCWCACLGNLAVSNWSWVKWQNRYHGICSDHFHRESPWVFSTSMWGFFSINWDIGKKLT